VEIVNSNLISLIITELYSNQIGKTKIYLNIPKTKHHSTLISLQKLCEVGQEDLLLVQLQMNLYILLLMKQSLRKENYVGKKKRILAIDSNPNYVLMS
jgi:hypothetical protein